MDVCSCILGKTSSVNPGDRYGELLCVLAGYPRLVIYAKQKRKKIEKKLRQNKMKAKNRLQNGSEKQKQTGTKCKLF